MVGLGPLLRDHATNLHADDLLVAISFMPKKRSPWWRRRGSGATPCSP